MRQKIKQGSPFLFTIIQFCNILLGATALTLFALSIWLWAQLNAFTIVELAFMFLGLFQLSLVILVCSAKKSQAKLKIFLLLMSILFIVQLTAAILVFALGDKIIDEVVDKTSSQVQYNQLKNYLYIVNYFVIGTLLVQLFMILLVKCYIGSLRERNSEYDYKVVDSEGNKISVQEKQLDDARKIKEKYSKKKEEMYQKYGRPQ